MSSHEQMPFFVPLLSDSDSREKDGVARDPEYRLGAQGHPDVTGLQSFGASSIRDWPASQPHQ